MEILSHPQYHRFPPLDQTVNELTNTKNDEPATTLHALPLLGS